jgi:sulfoxide reductase heme-binding subunit YedZ
MEWHLSDSDWRRLIAAGIGGVVLLGAAALLLLMQTPLLASVPHLMTRLFALDTEQTLWYATRAGGWVAYLLLWLSTAWGIAISSRILDPGMPRGFTFDAHEYLSLLALGFTAVHVGVLLFDSFLPFSLTQVLVPFSASYRPLWVGLGVIGMYLTVLVSVTFYVRRSIGRRAFRRIHYLSYAAYGLVTIHAWFAGTDTPLAASRIVYLTGLLVIVFLSVYRGVEALEASR